MRGIGSVSISLLMTLAISAQSADAQRAWLTSEEIRAELVGVQLSGIYPTNIAWTEFIDPDGTSDYSEQGRRQPGKWTVTAGKFCFRYDPPMVGGCFRITRHGDNCYELYTVNIGPQIDSPPPPGGMSWNGKMWREKERATCEDKLTS